MRPQLSFERLLTVAVLGLGIDLSPHAALADDKCIQAYEHGQELRQQKRLMEARAELRVCADPACPTATTSDCTRWLKEVEALLPSVHVHVLDPAGAPLPGARVSVDDREGPPDLVLAPGAHSVRCELNGQSTVRQVSIAEDERDRVVECVLTKTAPIAHDESAERALPVGTISAGVIAGIASAFWAGFGIHSIVKRNDLKNTCAPNCKSSDLNAVHNEQIAADVSMSVALGALAVGTVLFFVEKPYLPRQTTAFIVPSKTGCAFGITGRF